MVAELAVIYRDDEDEGEDFLVDVVVRVVVSVLKIVVICRPGVVVALENELKLEVDRLDVPQYVGAVVVVVLE
jgi:hypothetical protein